MLLTRSRHCLLLITLKEFWSASEWKEPDCEPERDLFWARRRLTAVIKPEVFVLRQRCSYSCSSVETHRYLIIFPTVEWRLSAKCAERIPGFCGAFTRSVSERLA